MSKSKGNFFLLREILEKYEGKVVRFFMLSSHYRKPIDFSDVELEMAKSAISRIENTVMNILEKLDTASIENGNDGVAMNSKLEEIKSKFVEAMDEDFNTAQAIGGLFELIKETNKYMEESLAENGKKVLKDIFDFIKESLIDVLGVEVTIEKKVKDMTKELNELMENLEIKKDDELANETSEIIEFLLEKRKLAKKEKNFALSDKIRDELANIGIKIKDGREKTTWTI